jgi:4-amino-4-deoxy-L-arabinose transferase-like glycosyltransferase
MPLFHATGPGKRRALVIASVTLLLLFSLALRLHHLDYESLWMDELRQISYYPLCLSEIVHYAASQQQPPLDYWIGHLVHTFSYSDFAVRLPAALFGVGTVLLLTLLTAKFCSWPVATGTGIISALLPFNLQYSQEARPYAIAIFLFLALLWSLERLLTSDKRSVRWIILLFFSAVTFLYSRALSPLVVTFVLMMILIAWLGILVAREGITLRGTQDRIILAVVAFVAALLLYLPIFALVLAQSQKYVGASTWFDLGVFVQGVRDFDMIPIWRAFIVQTEPLGLPILVMLILSPFLARRSGIWQKNPVLPIITILLPAASIVNIFVFQAKCDAYFKPQYAIYLLPLAVILAATTFQGMWELAADQKKSQLLRCFLLLIAGVLILDSVAAAMIFKTVQQKRDWRGLCAHLAASCGRRQVLLFDSLGPYRSFEHSFYGFPRYYKAQSSGAAMDQVPSVSSRMAQISNEPVLILLHEYNSTSYPHYSMIPFSAQRPKDIGYRRIDLDPQLQVTHFIGLSVIRLKKRTHNLARDAFILINRALLYLPQDSSAVEPHLAVAALARVLDLTVWQHHLQLAKKLDQGRNAEEIQRIEEHIRGLTPTPLIDNKG